MREIHGVISVNSSLDTSIKQLAVLFDKFYIHPASATMIHDNEELFDAFEFLQKQNIIEVLNNNLALSARGMSKADSHLWHQTQKWHREADELQEKGDIDSIIASNNLLRAISVQLEDILVRATSVTLNETGMHETVAICKSQIPTANPFHNDPPSNITTVMRVAVKSLPTPDSGCSWQDILDFKAELKNKRWSFHRFLRTLATKHQTEAEIRDEIEWMVNQYAESMIIHNIKTSQSFVEAYIVPAIEIIEDIAKLNFSKIAKNTVSIKKREVELMEGESKAQGRECAYVFEAQKRFGSKGYALSE
jgi:hypothetical protein